MEFRPLIVGGLGLTGLGTGLMALFLNPHSSILVPELAMALFGIGLGFTATALLIAVQTSVGWELRGVATASHMFFRTIDITARGLNVRPRVKPARDHASNRHSPG